MNDRSKPLRRLAAYWRRHARKRIDSSLTVARRRLATGIGAVLLALAALAFASMGDWAQHLFARAVRMAWWLPLIATPLIFAGVASATRRWAADARGSGIPQVIAAGKSPATTPSGPLVSMRTAAAKIALTIAMLFGGGSVGREGPTVQLAAAIMVFVHRLLRVPITAGVLIAGGAAGVAAAFNTPLAGVAFAIEELAAAYEQRVAVLVMGAVMISGLASVGIAGDYVYFGVMRDSLSIGAVLVIAPVAGIVGGLAGGLFSRTILAFSDGRIGWAQRVRRNPVLFAGGCGLVVALLGVASGGASWGTGYEATRAMVEGQGESLWFGPVKFLATLATTFSGAPGGIFAPSLATGAGVGNLLTPLFPSQPAGAVVLLGMVAYFVGVVRAPLTAVIILTETTASRGMILPLFLTALLADGVSAMVCRERLYHGLSKAFLPREPKEEPPGE